MKGGKREIEAVDSMLCGGRFIGKPDEPDSLLTSHGRKSVQEILQGGVSFDVVDESLDGNAGSFEARFTAHSIPVDPDDLVELSF